jgi:hypothetical protein
MTVTRDDQSREEPAPLDAERMRPLPLWTPITTTI